MGHSNDLCKDKKMTQQQQWLQQQQQQQQVTFDVSHPAKKVLFIPELKHFQNAFVSLSSVAAE